MIRLTPQDFQFNSQDQQFSRILCTGQPLTPHYMFRSNVVCIRFIKGEKKVALVHDNDDEIISGINITPLVDIMLVLLIIFMLVSTITDFRSIRVELPHAATGSEIHTKSVSVMISKEGVYYLDGQKVGTREELTQQLSIKKTEFPGLQVIISADKKACHEHVVNVIDIIRKLDINGFAINVEYTE